MPFPSLFRKEFPFFAFLITLVWGSSFLLVAQDIGTPGAPSTQDTGSDSIDYNAQVNAILDFYEQLSGKHLIRDANLNSLPPMTIHATGVSKADKLKLIETTLLLNGVAIVPVDERTAKAVMAQNKNPRSEGVKLYANAADLPKSDEIVSYYMPLNYISPQEAQSIFSTAVPIHPAYGMYSPAPSAQAVVLTENSSVIQTLIALKELIDVPPARVTSEFIQLNRADAEKTAELVNKLLDQQTGGAPGAPAGAPPAGVNGSVIVPASLGNNEPLFNERNLISGPAKIMADTRSNRLIIVTRPVNMPFLKQLITQLDQTDIYMVPQRRPLKYVLAQDILPALEAALAQGKEEEEQIKKESSPTANSNTPNQASYTPASSSSTGLGGGGGSVSAITPQLAAPKENNVPTVVTIGKTRILADNRSNSVIVFGSPDVVTRVFNMIDELDRKPLQVYLATVIGQLTVTEGMEFGIDILQKFQRVGQGGLANGLVTPGTNKAGSGVVPEPRSLTSSLGFPLPTGLTLYGAIGSTLDAYVRALESTDRFKVISRPSVYTTNNKLAVIASGSQVPVPSNTVSGFTGGNNQLTSSSSIQYEDVLLQLDIIPLINANHQVTLKIRQTNNSLGANQNISGNEVPTILTQEINTEVTVPDKSTVVIGGLISDSAKRDTSGVPFLSDIPILGYLFKDTTKNKERDELIIMIQPTVVESDEDQIAANETEKQRTILGRDAVQAAMGVVQTSTQTTTVQTETKVKTAPAKTKITTTKVTVKSSGTPANPTTSATSIVPAASSAAPDVSNGRMPSDVKPPPPAPTAP